MDRRLIILVCLALLLTVSVLVDLEKHGVLAPVLSPFFAPLDSFFASLAEGVRGSEPAIAVFLLFALFVFMIIRSPPWLPMGYLWSEWNKWQKIGRVRPGYFTFRLLGREFKGVNCGRKKIVFLEGDPEDYEINISDRSVMMPRFFGVSLEQRVLGVFFKPKYKAYAARVIEDPDEIINIGWGGEAEFDVDEVSGEVYEKRNPLDEKLPGSVLTRREALRGIISRMKNIIWVVPRWRTTDLKRLAEGEIGYMDIMVESERRVRNITNLAHYILKAYRNRIGKSILVSLISHLDACKQGFEEVDAAYTMLSYLFNVDVNEIKRSLAAAGIKLGEKPEEVLESWISQLERRMALLDRYRRVVSPSPKRGKERKKGLIEKIKQMIPQREKTEEEKVVEEGKE